MPHATTAQANDFPKDKAVNYYSSGEEVLMVTATTDAPGNWDLFWDGIGAWVVQEKSKGERSIITDPASGFDSHGGWGKQHPSILNPLRTITAAEANAKSDAELMSDPTGRTQAVCRDFEIDASIPANRGRLLGEAIPALSFAAGGPAGNDFGVNSVDMNGEGVGFKNPGFTYPTEGRKSTYENKWVHSDFVNVAYPINKNLYDNIVEQGSLK